MSVEIAAQDKLSYRDLKGEYNYIKNFMAGVISRFGDSIDQIAFTLLVFELTGSAVWLSIIFGVNKLPTILVQPFAGAWVERVSKKKIMVWTDIGRASVVALIGVLYMIGVLNPWILLVCTFINSTLEAFNLPAGMAMYPKILSKEKYTVGMSLSKTSGQVAEILGLAMAPLIIVVFGFGGAFLIDGFTFLGSALLMSMLKVKEEINKAGINKEKKNDNIQSYKKELKEGFGYLRQNKILWKICLAACLINAVLVPISTFQVAYLEGLNLGAEALSLYSMMLVIGLGLGSYVFPWLTKYFNRNKLFCGGGMIGLAGYIVFAILKDTLSVAVLLGSVAIISLIMGLSISLLLMAITIGFMQNVEDKYLARIGSIFNAMATSSMPITAFIFAIVANFLGVVQIYMFVGILGVLLFIMLSFDKELKNL